MTKNNIINFNGIRNDKQKIKDTVERASLIDLGTIYLDLYLTADCSEISMRPSYELDPDIDNALIDLLADMLKTYFPNCIDELFSRYKENNN